MFLSTLTELPYFEQFKEDKEKLITELGKEGFKFRGRK
jgi:hypothetical protein